MPPAVSVVVLAYGDEPHLSACIEAVLAEPDDLELLLVDNGAPTAVAALPPDDRLRVVRPQENTGFAGGCNLGAAETTGEVLVFVNSDAVLQPGAIAALTGALEPEEVALVCGCVTLASDPTRVNSVGNPVHWTGLSWAGGYGDSVEAHREPRDTPSITGSLFATRRPTWQALGGFDEAYFAYHEDAELSLRAWQRGGRVRYVPGAVAVHHYEFHRSPLKRYLLERNRVMTVLTTYPTPLLRRLLPGLLMYELVTCLLATVQGWLPEKLRGYRWLLTHRGTIRERRRAVQVESRLTAAAFHGLLGTRIEPANVDRPPGLGLLNLLLSWYFRLATRTLREPVRPSAPG